MKTKEEEEGIGHQDQRLVQEAAEEASEEQIEMKAKGQGHGHGRRPWRD